jgi:nitric oxide reductase NorE protein
VFAILFVTYLYYRAQDPAQFTASQAKLEQSYGAVNTVLLLGSSLLVAMAVRSVGTPARRIAPWLIAGAMACGLAFSGLKIVEYHEKVSAGITPATNEFFMYYFVYTGMHWVHLIVGLIVLSYLLILSRRPTLTARQFSWYEGGACYWHMVDLLWIVLFPLLYLAK